MDLLFKDGIYEQRETSETFSHPEIRGLAPLEGWQSLNEIGRAFGKPHSCVRGLLLPRGEIAPAVRRRQPVRCLTNALIAHMGNCVGGSRVLVWSEST